jgi:hypothetical protein
MEMKEGTRLNSVMSISLTLIQSTSVVVVVDSVVAVDDVVVLESDVELDADVVVVVVVGLSAEAMAHMPNNNAIAQSAMSDRNCALLLTTHPRGCCVPASLCGRSILPPERGWGQYLEAQTKVATDSS